jgi:hypothetical protein
MNLRDVIQELDGPGIGMKIYCGQKEAAHKLLKNQSQWRKKLLDFLEDLGVEAFSSNEASPSLTDEYSGSNLVIRFEDEVDNTGEGSPNQKVEQEMVTSFLRSVLRTTNLVALNLETKISKKNWEELKGQFKRFLTNLSKNLGEGIEGTVDHEGHMEVAKVSRILNEVSESVAIECLRLNNSSTSSQDENSLWKNKIESACHTNSNSFWNLSEVSMYKSTFLKDFQKMKSRINQSLESLRRNLDLGRLAESGDLGLVEWGETLDQQMEQNHLRILESFKKFEDKIESGTNSDLGNTQMKVRGVPLGMDFEERGSHLTGFHFIEIINNQTAGRILLYSVNQK